MALLSGVLIATIAGTAFTVFVLKPTTGAPSVATFEYRAKWVCNTSPSPSNRPQVIDPHAAENIGLAPGEYKTDINVHNPSHSFNITILKKFVVSTHEFLSGRPTTVSLKTLLFPDEAIFIDCFEIMSLFTQFCLSNGVTCPIEGFVVISQLSTSGTTVGFTSDQLDVVGEYSSESLAPVNATLLPPASTSSCIFPASTSIVPCVSTGISLDVEHIPPSPFVA